jgi:site-specific DNA-methyltransferase (adenine-specific)/site-specific DNA-methyltransferase (cytosine-N4-specific)
MPAEIKIGDCFELIKELPDNSIDLIITSPPYADIVNYGKNISIQKPQDYCDWLLPIFNEIQRVLKPSGSFILNINDTCKNGYRNPFIYELIYRSQKETKLKFYDTYIWHKMNGIPNGSPKRFRNNTEFIFHFVKDQKNLKFYMDRVLKEPAESNKERRKYNWTITTHGETKDGERTNKKTINYLTGSTNKTKEGYELPTNKRTLPDLVRPDNVVRFHTAGHARDNTIKHPAPFYKDLPKYYINLLTDDGDTILDIFGGIMTTGLACNEIGNRNFIGYELNEKYAEFGKKRIAGEEFKDEEYVINQYDEEGNFIQSFNTPLEIEKHFNKPCVNNIKNILRGFKRNFTLFGYEWKLEKNNYGKE